MRGRGDGWPPLGANDIHLAAQLFLAERLTLARELRGLTKSDLAAQIGKTPSAISQFESGRIRPDGRTVAELSLALSVSANFFTQKLVSGVMSVEACHFRSLRSATQRDRRFLLASGTLLCELVDLLAEYAEIPTEQVPRLDREILHESEIEQVAADVRKAWGLGLGPIPNIVWLLERHGVIVSYLPSDCAEVDAFSGWRATGDQQRPFVFLTDLKGATARSRFDAGHELGHLVMHVDAQPGNPDLERQANQFASALLMPRETFTREAPTWLNWDLIWELKRRWRVSARAILRRSRDLGRLSDASYRRGFIVLNQQYGMAEPFEPEREQPVVMREALAIAEEQLTRAEIADRLGLRVPDLERLLPGSQDLGMRSDSPPQVPGR